MLTALIQTDVQKTPLSELTIGELGMPSATSGGLLQVEDYEHGTIAYLRWREYTNALTINDVFTLPRHRKRGHANALLEELFAVAQSRGVMVALVVGGNNGLNELNDEELEAWYCRHGFSRHPKWGFGEYNVPILIRRFTP